ncbi:hypothetical protein D3C85_1771190 [compost metagenome]
MFTTNLGDRYYAIGSQAGWHTEERDILSLAFQIAVQINFTKGAIPSLTRYIASCIAAGLQQDIVLIEHAAKFSDGQ